MMPYQKNKSQTKQDPYLVQKIMSASPQQLIAYIYDSGITACSQNDPVKARMAVNALIKSLKFDHKEIATTFYNVYRRINLLINQKNFTEAKQIFLDLKQTWSQAFKVH